MHCAISTNKAALSQEFMIYLFIVIIIFIICSLIFEGELCHCFTYIRKLSAEKQWWGLTGWQSQHLPRTATPKDILFQSHSCSRKKTIHLYKIFKNLSKIKNQRYSCQDPFSVKLTSHHLTAHKNGGSQDMQSFEKGVNYSDLNCGTVKRKPVIHFTVAN